MANLTPSELKELDVNPDEAKNMRPTKLVELVHSQRQLKELTTLLRQINANKEIMEKKITNQLQQYRTQMI